MKITIKKSDYEKILAHANAQLPEEACGLIAGRDGTDGIRSIEKVWLLENIDHTNEHFSIDPKEQLRVLKEARTKGLSLFGNWHSHPETPARPSEEDKRLANDSGASYLILSLEDRKFPVLKAFHVEGGEAEKQVRTEELEIKGE